MRAICETCGQVQPPDWQPGDLCGHCGTIVRRDKRCYWCVELTPAGKFCRSCGAGQVPDEQYGAARWLKHLGADQFTIPERLGSLDPEQVEHFERLYQRHAAVAERHLDDLAQAESLARQRGWVRALEAALLPRLPLPDAELQALTLPPRRGSTEAGQLAEIRDATPFAGTRLLAALARLRLWQTRDALNRDDIVPDLQALRTTPTPADEALHIEKALTLSHWRLTMEPGGLGYKALTEDGLWAAQKQFPLEAAVNMALFRAAGNGQPQAVPADALASEDADLAFGAALAAQVPEPLLAALRVPARRYAAAYVLTRMQVDFALAPLLADFREEEVAQLLHIIHWQQRPRPDIRAFLQQLAAGQYGGNVLRAGFVQKAQELLALDLRKGEAVRLLRERPERGFAARLLQHPALSPVDRLALAYELVALDLFSPRDLPAEVVAQLPAGFVAEGWRTAPPNALQGLRQLAEEQLNTYDPRAMPTLHTFLRAVLWDEAAPTAARQQAWHVLQQWYQGYRHPAGLRLGFAEAQAIAYFGSLEAYVDYFVYGLEHLAILQAMNVESDFLRPLETAAEPADAPALLRALTLLPPPLVLRLRQALLALARDYDNWSLPRRWAVQTLALLQQYAPWPAYEPNSPACKQLRTNT
jgi:hypothetical protein